MKEKSPKREMPSNFNIAVAELTPAAQKALRRLQVNLAKQGLGSSIAQTVRVALDRWARETASVNGDLKGGLASKGEPA